MHANNAHSIGDSNGCVLEQPPSIPWIWEGLLVEGGVTLLSAPEKTGKTTLLSLLLDRRSTGGQLLGRAVYPGKTVVCSEENERLWALRKPPLDFGRELIFRRPSGEYPEFDEWLKFIDDLCAWSAENPFDLLVIDTAASFVPLSVRSGRRREAIGQLSLVADLPAAVWVLNQSRTEHRPLAAFADIVIQMEMPRGSAATRRRRFSGVGRYPDTLQAASAELNAAGTDYALVPDGPPPSLLGPVLALLAQSAAPLTCQELLARWPGAAPRADSLRRTLARGCETGLLVRTGSGTKVEAFRYGVREAEPN
jgi:hypothetical protein